MNNHIIKASFAGLLETFFTDRLIKQMQASLHTIESYRDTFRLLVQFAKEYLKKAPSLLTFEDIDAPFIGAFLDHIEKDRNNTARSRNIRLSAIHAFFKFAALHEPNHSGLIQRVLAIPHKKYDRTSIDFLKRSEIDAILAMPDQNTWIGRRDRTLLLILAQTGLRVSELIGLHCHDIIFNGGAYVHCIGKGRKERCTPLRKEAVVAMRSWLKERNGQPTDVLFPNSQGYPLSRDSIEYIVSKYVTAAQNICLTLENRRVSPHVFRHSIAMELLQNGVDLAVIALWLGHESIETTQIYIHANMQLKEKALAQTNPFNIHIKRYKPNDQLLAFLNSL
ncbi:MAG: site-specific integrase [bacterium]